MARAALPSFRLGGPKRLGRRRVGRVWLRIELATEDARHDVGALPEHPKQLTGWHLAGLEADLDRGDLGSAGEDPVFEGVANVSRLMHGTSVNSDAVPVV
jgi:hypothetical protein